MTNIDNRVLAAIIGGMDLSHMPLSKNIEDRRGESKWRHLNRRPTPLPFPPMPMPPLPPWWPRW